MLFTAFAIGIYSYVLLSVGLLGLLTREIITFSFIIFAFIESLFLYRKKYHVLLIFRFFSKLHLFEKSMLALLVTQAAVNLMGALGPELSFDALWYHLAIPKIFIENHKIFFIPGNLLYYSLFPKLTEMLYLIPISMGSEIGAKLIHFSFGILTLVVLYKLSRIFLSKTLSLMVILVFYANPVVGWESITAYIDLARTFFELFAFYYLVLFLKSGKKKDLAFSGILLGFSVAVKTLALGSVPIYLGVLFFFTKRQKIPLIMVLASAVSLASLPWFLYAYLTSGNPLYPLFSSQYSDLGKNYTSASQAMRDLFTLFFYSPDPISPLYLVFLPLAIGLFGKFKKTEKAVVLYALLSLILWIVTPRTGTSRFLLPYLPVISLAVVLPLKYVKDQFFLKVSYSFIVFAMVISIVYRGGANAKFLPYILRIETKEHFLMRNLNFSYGDFYDEKEAIKNIAGERKVLTVGLHNLYYVDFPFIDVSYAGKGDIFSFVLIQNAQLPSRFKGSKMVYENKKTHVKLYAVGDVIW